MSCQAVAAITKFLASHGLSPTESPVQTLRLDNGWLLCLGAQPELHVCILISCRPWELVRLAQRVLQRTDLRSRRAQPVQVFLREEQLVLLRLLNVPGSGAGEFDETVNELVQLALAVTRAGAEAS